jgi:hypothetical protein
LDTGILLAGACALLVAGSGAAAEPPGAIDPEAVIERILAVEADRRLQVKNVAFDAEYIEKDEDGVETARIIKKAYLKYLPDTTLFHEEYLQYYQDGRLRSDRERDNEASAQRQTVARCNIKNIAYRFLNPFLPHNRTSYDITYQGVERNPVEGFICYHFKVRSKEALEDRINGDFFFEAGSFHLVRADFSPARLVESVKLRLSELRTSMIFGPTPQGVWLPREIDVRGKGRAVLFIGVHIAGNEYYRNPVINNRMADKIFQGEGHE